MQLPGGEVRASSRARELARRSSGRERHPGEAASEHRFPVQILIFIGPLWISVILETIVSRS